MHTYKLKFEGNEGDMRPKSYDSVNLVEPGDVIELDNGMWHFVMDIRNLKSGTQLVLAESGQTAQQAATLGRQMQDG
ncbi:hypothetical protein PMI29_01307 [Pseudomonas sp. GM49]|nr:hypothetical protein PMI29_01307 [Pseudomonas sp. GM49]